MEKFSIGIIVFVLLLGLNYNSVFAKDGSSDLNSSSENVLVSNKGNSDEAVEGNLSEENKVKSDALRNEDGQEGSGEQSQDPQADPGQEGSGEQTQDPQNDPPQEVYYKVTFKYGEQTIVEHVKKGDKATEPDLEFYDKKSYWADEQGYHFDLNTPITRDIVLTLEREPDCIYPVSVNVNCYSNEGNKKYRYIIRMFKGNELELPKKTRAGYEFLGWYDKSGKQWKNGMIVEEPLFLYARWKKLDFIQTSYTVSPKTADDNNVLMYGLVLLVSIVTFIGVKRKNVG
jgi:hypothetical protein